MAFCAGVLIQEMIWQRSAKSLLLCGPAKICEALAKEPSELSEVSSRGFSADVGLEGAWSPKRPSKKVHLMEKNHPPPGFLQ